MTLGRKYPHSSSNAGDARKVYGAQSKVGSLSTCSSQVSICDMIEPPDWEELAEQLLPASDPLAYPEDDVEIVTVPRKIRTVGHVLPEEDLSKAPMFVRDCIRTYTSDYTVVEYKHRARSGSAHGRERAAERAGRLGPQHHYEVDMDPQAPDDATQQSESSASSGRQSAASAASVASAASAASSASSREQTPRGSWASLDLRSESCDALLPEVFDAAPSDLLDATNEARRLENRHPDLLGLYSVFLDEDEGPERRPPAEPPAEPAPPRLLLVCHQLKLELDIEPLFATAALYDARDRRKLTENFHFDLNSEASRALVAEHVGRADRSTLSRAAVLEVCAPAADVFLVVRLEKVLQGDLNECVEPYLKDDKNREKVRASAQAACARLGKYRMPFAWTAVSLSHVLSGASSLEREQDRDTLSVSSSSNSLERKPSSSLEQLRRRDAPLTRKPSVERREGPPPPPPPPLDAFPPRTVALTSFFKQETDKLRDEDLYKFLAELKRPSGAPKKLKCIPGLLKLEVSPCPEEVPNGLTPELAKLHPYDGDDSIRPCKEILSFPAHAPPQPHLQYRNLLFVYPKEINLSAYTNKAHNARNITVRVQLMCGEGADAALPAIFGRSACPEFTTEAYTTVLYHNKSPSLYDELKIRLPADLGEQHHLLFTVLHVACRRPPAPEPERAVETVVGYSWLPLCRGGRLARGEHRLPVMLEPPPPNYSYIGADVQLPGTRWLDAHRPALTVALEPCTTVHPADAAIERFATACEAVVEGNIPPRFGLANMEAELRASISELPTANVEALARHLPALLDRLLRLLLAPPALAGAPLNLAQDAFTALAQIFTDITNMNEGATCDAQQRSSLLATYIQYQCTVPRPRLAPADVGLPLPPEALTDGSCKILHEELALQWVVASGATRDLAMHNSWVLFDLMIKSMAEYLSWSGTARAPRRARFPDHYTDDVTTLVGNVTAEIISKYGKNTRLTVSLNASLAFFLRDLLSLADRGWALGLARGYYKQVSAKVASLPDAQPLVDYKLTFLRIVCSHEHLVSLCLPPPAGPAVGAAGPAGAAGAAERGGGPGASAASHSSGAARHALSHHYRSRHFLLGLLLGELAAVLDMQSPVLQSSAASALLGVLRAHDADPRVAPHRARVAALYLPLLPVVMDAYPLLYRSGVDNKDMPPLDDDDDAEPPRYVASPTGEYKQTPRAILNSSTTRKLLISVTWLVRGLSRDVLASFAADLTPPRLRLLLRLLDLCGAEEQYKGRAEIERSLPAADVKARLQDVILGAGSARSDLIMRKKGTGGTVCRWRKERARPPPPPLPALSAALAAEVSLSVLQALVVTQQTCGALEHGQAALSTALSVLLRALQRHQSGAVLQHMFAALRAMVLKSNWAWSSSTESWLCRVLLQHCGSALTSARAHAAATLYVTMRHHAACAQSFGRVKQLMTVSLSALVGTAAALSERALRRALHTLLRYAERDAHAPHDPFPDQVKDLVFNLHMILSDTVKMQEYQQDPEMLLDLMYRVARGSQHSPALRLTWLNSMAQKHMERGNHAEAAMCLVHGAALAAERGGGAGAAALRRVSHNVLGESRPDAPAAAADTRDMQALLDHAASELMLAGLYECVNEVYAVLLPLVERNRDYKKLANIHGKLHEAYGRVEALRGKRVFGAYFRVSFYGARFGDLDGEEFVYKEHALTRLPEICARLENFYGQRFGAENVVIIQDSNPVAAAALHPGKAYIQITYVEPYLGPHELRARKTAYERNFNINRFMYATPFTADGRAHGDILEQCKRKTVLTTAHHFPYVKTRIQVVHRTQIILTPIEVAIEDIQKKTAELAAATASEPPDAKMLQMVVQGCIGTTVNQGPLEPARLFLSQPHTKHHHRLRLAFKDFSKKCHDALKRNKNLIGADQREYQRELERNYARFAAALAPLVAPPAAPPAAPLAAPPAAPPAATHAQRLGNGVNRMDNKYQA